MGINSFFSLSTLFGGVQWACRVGWLALEEGGGGRSVSAYRRRHLGCTANNYPYRLATQQFSCVLLGLASVFLYPFAWRMHESGVWRGIVQPVVVTSRPESQKLLHHHHNGTLAAGQPAGQAGQAKRLAPVMRRNAPIQCKEDTFLYLYIQPPAMLRFSLLMLPVFCHVH